MNHLARPIRAGERILVRLVAFAQNELSGAHFSLEIVLEIVLEVAGFCSRRRRECKEGRVRALG